MTRKASKTKLFLARLVIVLTVAFVVLGVLMHGLSPPVFEEAAWSNAQDQKRGMPSTWEATSAPVF